MNIKEAKDYIKNSVQIYLKKDQFGEYRIPIIRQRPVFLLGAPGLGKTAIMEQIAEELGIALVSYSMTHHTRQSALGLPFIKHKVYEGMEYDVSEYTMSEIISSIYDVMEESGIKEGILFLDEINCVSETLAPSMLQFLQYKVFGRHRIPDGWVIVTAGNPPEYNKSVREFDVVTMDRLKILRVEADFNTWKEYAGIKGIHNAVINYLELKKEHFYHIEMTVDGRSYVTARGWEDLSEIISLYEEENLKVDEALVGQYLGNERIVREFCAYYDLYNKYKKDYRIEEILAGNPSELAKSRAGSASFDERLSLLGMLLDKCTSEIKENMETSQYLTDLFTSLKAFKTMAEQSDSKEVSQAADMLKKLAKGKQRTVKSLEKAGALSAADRKKNNGIIFFLQNALKEVLSSEVTDTDGAFALVKEKFEKQVAQMKCQTKECEAHLHNLFLFAEEVFQEGNEMLILVTELTVNTYTAKFISMFGSEDYQKHADSLMLSQRQSDIQSQIAQLDL
ncbi:MAG: AAA family ATPase [Lachnospiraceae bacterium]|nr:AAA family ATPase [Lachnospiraceae bacterium]